MGYMLTEDEQERLQKLYVQFVSKVDAECRRLGDCIPYIPIDGKYVDADVRWWTNGFWPGMLWQLYQDTGNENYRATAKRVEDRLATLLSDSEKLDHDLGFIWLHTGVASYRLTGDEESRMRSIWAADRLVERFISTGNYIEAWNKPAPSCLIIDCLMNLPLLYWASDITGDNNYRTIAQKHVTTVFSHLLREDGSCHHIAEMDRQTGECLNKPLGQGYGIGSSWSRGQSWSVYGLALAYRYLGEDKYLHRAKSAAHYFIANIATTDFVSVIDFRAPSYPRYMDTTATVIAACGLLELAEHVGDNEKSMYCQAAYKMLMAICKNYIDLKPETDGMLTHGSAKYHRESDREVKIIYGDYFLLELVMRFLDKDFLIW